MHWTTVQTGWYRLIGKHNICVAAVCREAHSPPWCVYVHEHMPPGDSRHKTLREAKEAALAAVREVACPFQGCVICQDGLEMSIRFPDERDDRRLLHWCRFDDGSATMVTENHQTYVINGITTVNLLDNEG